MRYTEIMAKTPQPKIVHKNPKCIDDDLDNGEVLISLHDVPGLSFVPSGTSYEAVRKWTYRENNPLETTDGYGQKTTSSAVRRAIARPRKRLRPEKH